MDNMRDIRQHIRAVEQTRQITKAMFLISSAKMRRALIRLQANEVYMNEVHRAMMDILTHTHDVRHTFLHMRDGHRAAYLVLAADKGLAGGYNQEVLKLAYKHIQAGQWAEYSLFTVGRMSRNFFEKKNLQVDVEFLQGNKGPTLHSARKISRALLELYDQKRMDEIIIISTRMGKGRQLIPQAVRLLPLTPEDWVCPIDDPECVPGDFYYEPSPKEVLDRLVPQYLFGQIYAALVDAYACEHSARMTAMDAATRNADEMTSRLRLNYNRARQAAITQEISEVVTTAAAMQL